MPRNQSRYPSSHLNTKRQSTGLRPLIVLCVLSIVVLTFYIREGEYGPIHAVRGGTIVGEHDIMFAGRDEVITLQHTAFSREIFAKGAVEAAKFLAGKPAGMYDMSDVIG